MTDPRHDDLLKGRRESASLIGVDADNLSPADTLRCDLISTLRLVIDDAGASILSGGSTDLGRLITATESLIKLLPGRELPKPAPPADDPNDPRKIMLATYMSMRRRGEIAGPEYSRDAALKRIAELEAKIAAMSSTAITPTESDIVPPGEIGECYAGVRPGPDDPPRRSPPVIEGEAVRPAPSRPPASTAPAIPVLVDVVSDPSADPRNYVEPDGSIRTTPRGRGQYWGPV
jgi:hypothetical protein